MKRFLCTCGLLLVISGCSSNEVLQSTSDTMKFNVRNVYTGGIIANWNGKGFNHNNWEIIEVETTKKTLLIDPSGWVKFKNPDADECLTVDDNNQLILNSCSNDKSMMFTLIPSTSGAVQLKSIGNQQCLGRGDSIVDFQFKRCIDKSSLAKEPVNSGNLWMINPSLNPAKYSPLFIK
ncbi:hypothetical protein PVK64_19870 [Aliivibrio sp. S4TY2]|uniref:hypothetical protein n=1 Tax=unclassified Aliivibrio TaxID=2645654 RepID=UPI002378C112|nr:MULTISPECIES: hypothetical protein [unclassified Aliivibrio]MDD9158427.1 hypothetical protein [Aliivibrio sp. S4TY2]MDD9162427.1 hypothetical protein [Aliivibrio sp. S4TY1]MDD9166434.1 hypothetical protein [Aliivibrio sp. S4MY2]MDD9170436.1 hypothetical protein [Aliivibrio sp. S4MY4]MDD9187513.1 hypothetical protein [Aliivibrio sp. S4MY3]